MYEGVRKPQKSDFPLSFDDALKMFLSLETLTIFSCVITVMFVLSWLG